MKSWGVHRLSASSWLATYCLVLLCLPAVGSASSPPADSVHFCAASEYEAWLGDNPRPAGKRAAELNVGEPRTVRMIFFRPARSYFRPKVVDSMKVVIRRVQAFFAENMQAHGYGNRTFRIETDADGEPVVHYVIGQQPLEHYRSGSAGHSTMNEEIGQSFDLQANVYLVVADHIELSGGFGYRSGKNGGYATVGTWWARAGRSYAHIAASFFRVAAHELGHAFGLSHDFRDDTFIMSYGHGPYRLSACAAEYLSVHPYFNSDIPLATESAPTIELISPVRYPGGSLSVSLRFEVGDAEGLHQVILLHPNVSLMHASGYLEVYACRGMAGENEAVVEFEFGPGIALKWRRRIFESKILRLGVRATDTDGNVTSESINLVEVSEHQIAILEGHNDRVTSLAYSPDGTILASGSYDRTIRLWDMAAKEEIAPMEGHRRLVTSVAFSPDGTTLASGSASIRLWDVAAREEIATLEGHSDWVSSVAFSPDGTTLASGSFVGRSSCGTWRRERRSPRWRGIAIGSSLWCFLPMGPPWLSGLVMEQSGCGTWRRERRSPRCKGIAIGSILWCFLLTGPPWLQGLVIGRSSCGTWWREKRSPRWRVAVMRSILWCFRRMGPPWHSGLRSA